MSRRADGSFFNPGLEKAWAAAMAIGAVVSYPQFSRLILMDQQTGRIIVLYMATKKRRRCFFPDLSIPLKPQFQHQIALASKWLLPLKPERTGRILNLRPTNHP